MGNAAEKIDALQPYAAELVELNDAEQQLAELKAKYGTVPDYATKEGYVAGKKAIQALTKMRTGTDKARLAITKPHRDFIDQVNQRAKGLIGEVEQLEKPHRDAKTEVDEAEERKKEERIARLRERLAKEVTSYLDSAVGLDSSSLADLIDAAETIDTGDYFDITNEAEDEAARVLRELRAMHEQTLQRERLAAEREELERERAELARLRAEQAPVDLTIPAEPAEPREPAGQYWFGDGKEEPFEMPDEPADSFGEALEDLQSAGLDASQAIDVLSAIQRGDVRRISFG